MTSTEANKYKRLAAVALKVVDLDDYIINELKSGNASMLQAYYTSRILPVQNLKRLAAWIPPID